MADEKTTPKTLLVRIKPFDKKRGNLTRRYTYRDSKFTQRGYVFREDRGWYEVPLHIALYLKSVRRGEAGPKIFDVKDREGAVRLDRKESIEKEERAKATRARSASDAGDATDAIRATRQNPEQPSPEEAAERFASESSGTDEPDPFESEDDDDEDDD